MGVIYAKAALSVVLTAAVYVVVSARRGRRFVTETPAANAFGAMAAMLAAIILLRVLPFVALYVIYGARPTSDVADYFWPWAQAAAAGQVVYRDFDMHFGPLFPYVLSLALFVWSDPRAIVLLMVIVEVGAIIATSWLMWSEGPPEKIATAVIAYLLSPAPLIFVIQSGQEDVWLWAVAAVVGVAVLRRRDGLAGAISAIGALATKALLGFGVFAMLCGSMRPKVFLKVAAAVMAVALPPLVAIGGSKVFTLPLAEARVASPPNVWFTLNALTGGHMDLGSRVFLVVSLVVLMSLILLCTDHRAAANAGPRQYCAAWVITYALFMLFSVKSLGNYACIFLLPLTFLGVLDDDKRLMSLTMALSALVSIQTSLWYRLDRPTYHHMTILADGAHAAEFMMSAALLAILVAVIVRSRRYLTTEASPVAMESREASIA